MTPEERELLETTARSLLKLQREIHDRVNGMEIVLQELFRSNGRTDIALARIRIWADLLKLKGTPCTYLNSFVEDFSARPPLHTPQEYRAPDDPHSRAEGRHPDRSPYKSAVTKTNRSRSSALSFLPDNRDEGCLFLVGSFIHTAFPFEGDRRCTIKWR